MWPEPGHCSCSQTLDGAMSVFRPLAAGKESPLPTGQRSSVDSGAGTDSVARTKLRASTDSQIPGGSLSFY